MTEIYFGNFRTYVIEHIKAVESDGPEPYSIEWFLLKYLNRIVKTANPPTTVSSMENAMRALISFYVDKIDEHSELGDRCLKINEEFRKTLRYKTDQQ